ncbi:MAG: ZPR1 zinc finger domain-containing protein [Candidatus Lokiarchaeota archaeon]|nr:ZPR1 zinc finger domain-containing protein [Candidatus Lokiarchaeota archaeon]
MSTDTTPRCPICTEGTLTVKSMLYSVPFFNELAMFMMVCSSCNFTHNDIFSAESYEPTRWTLRVTKPSMLNIRIVRSSSGTIRIPDFGIDVEPGPAAESFITNVEGLLYRIRPVVESAIRFAEEDAAKKRGNEVLENILSAIRGELEFTLIIEDPSGVSGILPEDLTLVKREVIPQQEAAQLKGAPMWVDNIREEVQERKD